VSVALEPKTPLPLFVSTVSVLSLLFALIKSILPSLLTSAVTTHAGPLPTVSVAFEPKPPVAIVRQHRQRAGILIRGNQIEFAVAVDIRRHNIYRPAARRPDVYADRGIGAKATAAIVRQHRQRAGCTAIRADQINFAVAIDIRRHDPYRPIARPMVVYGELALKPKLPLPLFVSTVNVLRKEIRTD